MVKEINLKEILTKYENEECWSIASNLISEVILPAMKEACEQTLELAAENAELNVEGSIFVDDYKKVKIKDDRRGDDYFTFEVDKESILNTINQVKK